MLSVFQFYDWLGLVGSLVSSDDEARDDQCQQFHYFRQTEDGNPRPQSQLSSDVAQEVTKLKEADRIEKEKISYQPE